MNSVVKKILTVSAVSFSIIAINCNTVNASAATCVKPVQFVGQVSFGVNKQKGKIKRDNDELEKLYKEVKKKVGDVDEYQSVQSPTNLTMFNALTQGNNPAVTATITSTNKDNTANASYKMTDSTSKQTYADVTIVNELKGNTAVASVEYTNRSKLDDEAYDVNFQYEENAPRVATLQLQATPTLDESRANNAVTGYDNLLKKNSGFDVYHKWDSFKTHSGDKWMWFGDLRLGAQFNLPIGGFMRIMALGGLPFNKTIECTEETSTDNNTNNATNNTDNKDKSAYTVTQKWNLGGLLSFGANFNEKFYMALNVLWTYSKFNFAPKSSDDSKSTNNNTSNNTTDDKTITLTDKFDMKSNSISAELEFGYNITQNISAFIGLGYKPEMKLKKASSTDSSSTLPVAVSIDGGLTGRIGVGFVF